MDQPRPGPLMARFDGGRTNGGECRDAGHAEAVKRLARGKRGGRSGMDGRHENLGNNRLVTNKTGRGCPRPVIHVPKESALFQFQFGRPVTVLLSEVYFV